MPARRRRLRIFCVVVVVVFACAEVQLTVASARVQRRDVAADSEASWHVRITTTQDPSPSTPKVPGLGSSALPLAAAELQRYLHISSCRSDSGVECIQTRRVHWGAQYVNGAAAHTTGTKLSQMMFDDAQDAIVLLHHDSPLLDALNQVVPWDMSALVQAASRHVDAYAVACAELGTGQRLMALVAQGDTGLLYAAYHVAEELGMAFSLDGDVYPDKTHPDWHPTRRLPLLQFEGVPSFDVRGLQPFHDFFQGPDWWSADMYKAVLSQIPKLKMNFFGLHTYPYATKQATGTNEPTVWLGFAEDVNPDGTVTKGYPAAYASTLRGQWGMEALPTGAYHFGAAKLFDAECYGSPVQDGNCPFPTTEQGVLAVFDATARLLNDSFTFGRAAGVQTCVGTQTPLVTPTPLNDTVTSQQYYEGMFTRIQRAYPIDWYWVWTPEQWEWGHMNASNPVFTSAVDDLKNALAAHSTVNAPWEMATCGWVVGPLPNRDIFDKVLPAGYAAITSLDMDVGNTPVDPAYENITKHHKWAIPWMEDDPGLTAPQLWVNRTIMHMNEAQKYGINGILGIHWRTRAVGPQISAMAQRSWAPSITSAAFWATWCASLVGAGPAADTMAAVFRSVDSFLMPRPVNWIGGPGGLQPSAAMCNFRTAYAFADRLAAARPLVSGALNLARFDYWLASFQYMRAIASFECEWAAYDTAFKTVSAMTNRKEQMAAARAQVLPLRIGMVANATTMLNLLQDTVSTPGGLGTISNVLQHSLPKAFESQDAALTKLLGEPLPASAALPQDYTGSNPHVTVPAVRGSVAAGEPIDVRAVVVAPGPVPQSAQVVVHWRAVESESGYRSAVFTNTTMSPIETGRAVYVAQLPVPEGTAHAEYYVTVTAAGGRELVFPPGAPANTQSVVVVPGPLEL